jgi:activator of 2-hydroxyglutaryl-CoA dehydratase
MLSEVLKIQLAPLSVDAQLMGALGAAVIAKRRAGGGR